MNSSARVDGTVGSPMAYFSCKRYHCHIGINGPHLSNISVIYKLKSTLDGQEQPGQTSALSKARLMGGTSSGLGVFAALLYQSCLYAASEGWASPVFITVSFVFHTTKTEAKAASPPTREAAWGGQ